jgi:hypothetical protein
LIISLDFVSFWDFRRWQQAGKEFAAIEHMFQSIEQNVQRPAIKKISFSSVADSCKFVASGFRNA